MPPVYMIFLRDHPISVMYTREVRSSWKNYDLNLFNGTKTIDLPYRHQLIFDTKTVGKKREFTRTEKAVWYSHFDLWCKCMNQGPLIVVEHDSKLIKPLPDLKNEGYKFLSFINRDFGKKGIDIAPGSGYYITPQVAERLVSRAVCQPIIQNSDGHLSSIMNWHRQKKMNDFYYIEQINFDGLNTIDHKNPNRNFIDLDYDKLDFPILHSI